ncbi:MAG: leucyl aminopeptidase [Alphaproteobacteria bacterium]|nr:leucyl aminopeptidase [Alphaproteobacteria bacterium]
MTIPVSFDQNRSSAADTVVVFVYANNQLCAQAGMIDRETEGLITRYLSSQERFQGKEGQTLVLTGPLKSAFLRIVLCGLGDPETYKGDTAYEAAGGAIAVALENAGAKNVDVLAENETMALGLGVGMALRAYRFDKYKVPEDEAPLPPASVRIVTKNAETAQDAWKSRAAMIAGVYLARDLATEPPNALYPDSYAKRIKADLGPLGVKVEIFDEKKLEKLGFYAHLAVAQGAANPARLVVMRWNGAAKKAGKKPLALVGKGITFDTGGVHLKPGGEMLNIMKMDMAGSAAVVGAMKALALRKARADVVAVVGLAENRISHNSYLPGDVIRTLAGKSVEIDNTDAEGRLVLADALTYVQKTFDPAQIIDLATLTGSVLIALGHEYGGAFVNDDTMWTALDKAGTASGDKLWRLPLHETYRKSMKSSAIADLSNLGSMTPYGGTCTAAAFLELFIDEGRPWAHLDIAGSAWIKTDRPTCPKTFTGFGARLLDRFVADTIEATVSPG